MAALSAAVASQEAAEKILRSARRVRAAAAEAHDRQLHGRALTALAEVALNQAAQHFASWPRFCTAWRVCESWRWT